MNPDSCIFVRLVANFHHSVTEIDEVRASVRCLFKSASDSLSDAYF